MTRSGVIFKLIESTRRVTGWFMPESPGRHQSISIAASNGESIEVDLPGVVTTVGVDRAEAPRTTRKPIERCRRKRAVPSLQCRFHPRWLSAKRSFIFLTPITRSGTWRESCCRRRKWCVHRLLPGL